MITTPAIQAARRFLDADEWALLLLGRTGSGKTYAAEWALDHLARRWRQAYYDSRRSPPSHDGPRFVLAGELGRKLYEQSGQRCFVDVVREAGVLVLDDLGVEHIGATGAFLSALDEVMSYRHRCRLKTIITTNLTRDELRKRYGVRIYDRLRDGLAAECAGESLRGSQTKEQHDDDRQRR